MSLKKQSSSQNRAVKSYLKPQYYRLMKGYAAMNELSESRAVYEAIKIFFDNMPKAEKERIISHGEQQKVSASG